jgi:hypothetical protein
MQFPYVPRHIGVRHSRRFPEISEKFDIVIRPMEYQEDQLQPEKEFVFIQNVGEER